MPVLLSVPEFAHYIGKSERWVRDACEDGVIVACQIVGRNWVIAQDTLFRPRAISGIDGMLLDYGLPEERIIGKTYVVPAPEYKGTNPGNKHGNPKRKIVVKSWPRIREKLGVGREKIYKLTGVTPETQKKLEKFEPVTSAIAWKIAYNLDMDIEDVLRT